MVRNILIVGITGSGKSGLANVLTNSNNFEESASNVSKTKEFQYGEFEENDTKYHVIDNIGFGDTNKIIAEDILLKIGEGIYSAKEGINQILFVFKGRFSQEQIATFNLFKRIVSESKITKFTTLVRTNFPSFRDLQECKEDEEKLTDENATIKEIISSCNGIIYIDNPPIPKEKKRAEISKKKKEESRKRIISHLEENCLENYRLKAWDNIYSVIVDYIKQKEKETEEKRLEKLKSETITKIRIYLEVEFPAFNLLNAAVEQNTKR